jgi:hypothetical protein
MKELYLEKQVGALIRRYRRSFLWILLSALLSLSGFLVCLDLVKGRDYALYLSLGTLSLLLGGFLALGVFFFLLRPTKKRILLLERLLGNPKKEGEGVIEEVKPLFTLSGDHPVIPLVLIEKGESKTLYVDALLNEAPFQKGECLHYLSSDGYLFAYEVKHD